MGRKRQPKKKPPLRHPQPKWISDVDEAMWRYLKAEFVIGQQEEDLDELRQTGRRMIGSYELKEGGFGGPMHIQEEDIVLREDAIVHQIERNQKTRTRLDNLVQQLFGHDPDKIVFIRRYWWTTTNKTIYVRTGLVLQVLDFLSEEKMGDKPNRTFYRWREEIYQTLADYMGYRNLIEKSDLPYSGQEALLNDRREGRPSA